MVTSTITMIIIKLFPFSNELLHLNVPQNAHKCQSTSNQKLICWPRICHYTSSSKDLTCLHDVHQPRITNRYVAINKSKKHYWLLVEIFGHCLCYMNFKFILICFAHSLLISTVISNNTPKSFFWCLKQTIKLDVA